MSSAERLEFFLDRSLGRITAFRLREAGYVVHLIADHYANDIGNMTRAFLDALPKIERAAREEPVGFWHVYRDGKIKRMWP